MKDRCLDIYVWSVIAVVTLVIVLDYSTKIRNTKSMQEQHRTMTFGNKP